MAEISILIALLLQLCTMIQALPPCSEYYKYIAKSGTMEILGQIKIPFSLKNETNNLRVGFNTRPEIHIISPIVGIELAESLLETVQQDSPLLYHVHFPVGQAIPKLTRIRFNNQQLCPSPEEAQTEITTIEVTHPFSTIETVNETSSDIENTLAISRLPENIFQKNNDSNECGVSSYTHDTVLLTNNGESTLPGQWPWLAAIFILRLDYEFKCAGTILTNKHILTAAQCLKLSETSNITIHPNVLVVALGRFNLRQWRERGAINREVENFTIHPDYAHTINADSDLAVLNLRTSVEFSPFIRPICLWSGSSDIQSVVNNTGWVVGWGEDELGRPYTEDPRMIRMPIINNDTCHQSDWIFSSITSERTFCAGWRNLSGPCNGDSGSGLVLYDNTTNHYQLRGIMSRALPTTVLSCDLKYYVVYTDVAKYKSWIEEQISDSDIRNATGH